MEIYTIGYEGASIDVWLKVLSTRNITCLVDIRERPISRKKGFSKTKLMQSVEALGIKYIHIKELGSPSDIRTQLHKEGDYITFFERYEQHLDHQIKAINELSELAQEETICLLCFEQNHARCHRNSVAKRLKSLIPKEAKIINVDCSERVAREEHFDYGKNLPYAQ